MRSQIRRLALLLCFPIGVVAQGPTDKPGVLHEGDSIVLQGVLAAGFTGWRPHILLRTTSRIRVVDEDDGAQNLREIEIAPSFHEFELSKHLGQSVRVSGRIQIAYESSYYWNGVMIMPSQLVFADGQVQFPAADKQDTVPGAVQRFLYTTILVPRRFEAGVNATDLATGTRLPAVRSQNCGIAGGGVGGIANCSCPAGFVATRGYAGNQPVPLTRLATFQDPEAPQLVVPESATRTLVMEVLCVRKNASEH